MLFENMSMAFSAIRANKMRSFLTMLGIIIGIGSVISIVSIGDTMRALFVDLYKSVGLTRSVILVSWYVDDFKSSDYFTLDELNRVKELFADDIAYIDSDMYLNTEVLAGRKKQKYSFQGIDYNYDEVQTVNIVKGRMFNEGDVIGRKYNVILEEEGAKRLFGGLDPIGQSIRMDVYGTISDFTVIGIYRKEMTPFEALMMGGNSGTEAAFIPYTILTWPNDLFQDLNMYSYDDTNLEDFGRRLTSYVAKLKGRDESEIMFQTAKEQAGSYDMILGGLSAAVGGIAAISLVVGGIGIMNIMLVSVTERTREIGIRKALGARTSDVLLQFLIESAILSGTGGIIGVLIGVGIVSLGGLLFGIAVVIKPAVILLAVGFSAMVGIFFGLYPASKAAKADPIDALRYE